MRTSIHLGIAMLVAMAIYMAGMVGVTIVVNDTCHAPVCDTEPRTTTTTQCTEDMACWQPDTMGNREGS